MPKKKKEIKKEEAELEMEAFGDNPDIRSEKSKLADKLTAIAVQQIDTSIKFKQTRLGDIQLSEELYFGKTKPALKGRFNVPLPIMSGFIDTLISKVDDPPRINYGYQDLADYRRAKKIGAAWEIDSSPTKGKWNMKDRMVKKLAAFSGVGVYKYYAESEPKYKSNLEVVDFHDFECEPLGGADLENHKFLGQRNIFKTAADLLNGVKAGTYDATQVRMLLAAVGSDEYKKNDEIYKTKIQRLWLMGLDPETHSYVGQKMYNMTEWYMEHNGERYYMLLEPRAKVWVRFEKLNDVFESNLWPFVAWHTHEDAFNFWSKAPADDMRPIADAMQVLFNQALDNRQKRNFGQRAFDPTIFPDPSQLEWRPDGLVEAKFDGIRPISQGIFEFQTAEITGTIDLMQYIDDITGRKTGITADTQGASEEKRVGILYSNLQQVADRLGLYNKAYSEAWAHLGQLYKNGLQEHAKGAGIMVKMIGEAGVEWEELVKEDLEPEQDLNISISGGQAELQADELKKKSRTDALAIVMQSPTNAGLINPKWSIEQILRTGGYEEEDIRIAMDVENYGNMDILSKASQAIQDIIGGREPKRYRGANTAFIQKILDFASDNELDQEIYDALIQYADSHVEVAIENMMRKARIAAIALGAGMEPGAEAGGLPGMTPVGGAPPGGGESFDFLEKPLPNTPGGTAARSAGISNLLTPQ